MHQRQRILQLITKAKAARGLVETGPRPQSTGEVLVQKPVIEQQIQRAVGCFYAAGARQTLPELPGFVSPGLNEFDGTILGGKFDGCLTVFCCADGEGDLGRCVGGQVNVNLQGTAGFAGGDNLTGQTDAAQCGRVRRVSCRAEKFAAVGREAMHGCGRGNEGDTFAARPGECIACQQRAVIRADVRDNERAVVLVMIAKDPLRVERQCDAPSAIRRVAQRHAETFGGVLLIDETLRLLNETVARVFEV